MTNLQLDEGERTKLALDITSDDGLMNGASNIIKLVQYIRKMHHQLSIGYSLITKMLAKILDRKLDFFSQNESREHGHQSNQSQQNLLFASTYPDCASWSVV